jgi:hypothetical protein
MKVACLSLGLLCLVSVSLLVCNPREETPPQEPTSHGGAVLRDLPVDIRPDARYLFYLHGAIIEEGGLRPEHPKFGFYEYEAILDSLAAGGLVVISEARGPGTNVSTYAEKVTGQIRQLLETGVPPEHISVVGHSKGGAIAIMTSSFLKNDKVNFAFMACCGNQLLQNPEVDLHGRILSIYEASDEWFGSCQKAFDQASHPLVTHEIEMYTGEGHGAFYRPISGWVEPVVNWAQAPN